MKKIINKKSLKGTLAVMLCAVMAFSVCACDFDSDTEPTKTDAQIQFDKYCDDLFSEELTEGMYQDGTWFWPEYRTDCKAGLIKSMIDINGLKNPKTVDLLTAAGLAAKRTGSPIMLHTENVDVLEAIDLLAGKIGVPEKRILVCHVDRQVEDYSIHKKIAQTGVFMEYDTITLFEFHNVASEIKMLRYMIDEGFLSQILISTDPTTDRLKNYFGIVGIDYILTEFIPLLQENGFSENEIYQMTHSNPWSALSKN